MHFIQHEIIDLHDAVEAWIAGRCDGDDVTFETRIGQRFHQDFALIAPGGMHLSRGDVLQGIRQSHGANPPLGIKISDIHIVAECEGVVVATCTAWQRHAKFADRPRNARALTAVFTPNPQRASGHVWLHAQETWLSAARQDAGAYDWE